MGQGTVDDRVKALLKMRKGHIVEIRAALDNEDKMLVWVALMPNESNVASIHTHPHRRTAAALYELELLVEGWHAKK